MSFCPHCAARTTQDYMFRHSFSYCCHCGWNVSFAERMLRQKRKTSWILVGLVMILDLIASARGHAAASFAIKISFVFLGYWAILGVIAQLRLLKITGLRRGDRGTIGGQETPTIDHAPDAGRVWSEYYHLRNWARLSLLALPFALYLLTRTPATLALKIEILPSGTRIIFVLVVIGVATVLFCAPILKWAEWDCPRCGQSFSLAKYLSILTVVPLAFALVFNSWCVHCKLRCGSELKEDSPLSPG
jgi:hypothetical protein